MAPAERLLRRRQRRPQYVLGEAQLPFPQEAQPGDEHAPPRRIGNRAVLFGARGLLLVAACEGGFATQDRERREAIGVYLEQTRLVHRRCLGPGLEDRDEAVGLVGVGGGAARDERAFVAQGVVHIRPGEDAFDEPFCLGVPLAERQHPGSSEP